MSDAIIAEYVGADPTHKNSRELVKEIANRHGLTVPKVRRALMDAGVYISQPKLRDTITPEELAYIDARATADKPTLENSSEYFDALAAEIGVRRNTFSSHIFGKPYYPMKPLHREIHDRIAAERAEEDAKVERQRAREDELRVMARKNKARYSGNGRQRLSSILWIVIFVTGIGLMLSMCITGNYGPTSSDRYDSLSEEGKDHVDKSMRDYDSFCSKNPSRC